MLTAILTVQVSHAGQVLLEDDFDDETLDATKWSVVTSGIPQGSAEIREVDGHLESINGAFLNTAEEFKPQKHHAIMITGIYRGSTFNYFEVDTRSDGVPGGDFGHLRTGIEFHINEFGDVRILERQNHNWGKSIAFAPLALSNIAGGLFAFQIVDNGRKTTFEVSEIGNPGNAVALSGTLDKVFDTNHVTIASRERIGQLTQVGIYDDIVIRSIPEPGGMLLALLALVGVGSQCLYSRWYGICRST